MKKTPAKPRPKPEPRRDRTPRGDRGLSLDEEVFVGEYLKDRNASAAYERMRGQKLGNARQLAHHYMERPRVLAEIRRRTEIAAQNSEINLSDVIGELKKIAFKVNVDDFTVIDPTNGAPMVDFRKIAGLPDEERRAIMACFSSLTTDVTHVSSDRHVKSKHHTPHVQHRVRYSMWSKIEALNLLGKHLGMKDGTGSVADAGSTVKVVGGLPDPEPT